MPAFNQGQYEALQTSVQQLFNKVVALHQITLTHEEAIALITPPEHRKLMFEAAEHCQLDYYSSGASFQMDSPELAERIGLESLDITMWLHGSKTPCLPRNPAAQKDTPQELQERVIDWAAERVKIGRDFGKLKQLILSLSQLCTSPQQVRYFFPGVLVLLRMDPTTETLIEKMGTYRAPKQVPTLPVAVRQACKDCAALVASTQLLPDPEVPTPNIMQATISMGGQGWDLTSEFRHEIL